MSLTHIKSKRLTSKSLTPNLIPFYRYTLLVKTVVTFLIFCMQISRWWSTSPLCNTYPRGIFFIFLFSLVTSPFRITKKIVLGLRKYAKTITLGKNVILPPRVYSWRSITLSTAAFPQDTCVSYQQVLELMQMHPKERFGRVILTASWFNNINIGYRFHTSTVCHSCCNNVTYISEENLDISGSAWKKCHGDMAFLLARIVLVLKLYRARAVFAPCKHQQPDCGPVLAYYLWHILIFVLYRYESNKCI